MAARPAIPAYGRIVPQEQRFGQGHRGYLGGGDALVGGVDERQWLLDAYQDELSLWTRAGEHVAQRDRATAPQRRPRPAVGLGPGPREGLVRPAAGPGRA